MSAELVTLTIDGVEVQVPKGTLVIRAAEQIGKYIPRFCDHPLLDPLGACRQCLVEVEGQRKPLTACTTTATEGMIVKTQMDSTVAADAQKGVLELLLINHPLDCPMCDKGGECPLQDQALAYGPGGSRYIDPKRRFPKPIPISPLIKLDRERCVLCARCTRFADQIAGDPFIELFERGALEQVGVFEDEPYESIFSGNVVQICPVGALTATSFRFLARPFDMRTTGSTCTRCASGCSVNVQERRGGLTRILASANPAVNDEWLCDKGRFASTYIDSPERITEPLIRKGGETVAVSWAEAIDLVAAKIAESDGNAAVIAGGQLLDEDGYALSRFARTVLKTNAIESRRGTPTAEDDDVLTALNISETATNESLDRASLVLVLGSDLHQESPIVFLRLRKLARLGLRIREIGGNKTLGRIPTASWTACRPSDEGHLLRALAAALEAKGNSGLDPYTRAAASGDIDELLKASGLSDEDLGRLVEEVDAARGSIVILAGERLAASPGALSLAWNLSVALGGRFGWVPRKAGARGAAWAGLHGNLLPGGRRVDDEGARAEVEKVWGAPIPSNVADAFASSPGVLFLVGADPVADHANAGVMDRASFTVSLDMFSTASSSRADVILPVVAAPERAGNITNWEGRTQMVRGAIPAPGLAQADHEILAQIASAAGISFPQTLEQLHEEMNQLDRTPDSARPVTVPAFGKPTQGLRAVAHQPLLDDGSMMIGADLLAETADEQVVVLAPKTAARLKVSAGETVTVTGAGITVRLPLRISADVAADAVVLPARKAAALTGAPVEVSL